MDANRIAQRLSQSMKLGHTSAVLDVSPWYEGDNSFYINRIFVPDKYRNMRVGSRMMGGLIYEAIEAGATLIVHPTANYGSDVGRLSNFFARFGFEEHPTAEGAMIWRPKDESM